MIRTAFLYLFIIQHYFCLYAKSSGPMIIAHRGASGQLPEHTLEAFSLAYGQGADFLEPDLVLTKDGVPIILHDIYLESTTNVDVLYPMKKRLDGHYYAIDFTLDEIKSLSVGERNNPETKEAIFPSRFPAGFYIFKIPTFEEFLILVEGLNKSKQKKIGIYPEIKRPKFHRENGLDITKIVYELIRTHGYEEKTHQIYIQSFDFNCLKRLKNQFTTKIPLIFLINKESIRMLELSHENYHEKLETIKEYATGLGCSIDTLVEKISHNHWQASKFMKITKKMNFKIHAYTLRADKLPEKFQSYNELVLVLSKKIKVDGIFTDFTEKTKKILNKN